MRVHRWATREGTRGLRAFLILYGDEDRTLIEGRFEGYVASGARHTGIGLRFEDESPGPQVFVGLAHVANIWLTIGSWLVARRVLGDRYIRDWDIFDLTYHNRTIWWSIWHSRHEWHSKTPRWRHGRFRWWDFLAGKAMHRSEPKGESVLVDVPMPEGTYQAVVKLGLETWKRPRWPWPQIGHSYNITVLSRPTPDGPRVPDPSDADTAGTPAGYIPIPGKGENAWDCGPDGIFSMSGSARTIEEAIGHLVAAALRDRKRRGYSHDYAEPIT